MSNQEGFIYGTKRQWSSYVFRRWLCIKKALFSNDELDALNLVVNNDPIIQKAIYGRRDANLVNWRSENGVLRVIEASVGPWTIRCDWLELRIRWKNGNKITWTCLTQTAFSRSNLKPER